MKNTLSMMSALNWREVAEPAVDAEASANLAQYGRPHVCFVAPLAWPVLAGIPDVKVVGGAEVQQTILARALVQAGLRVSMVSLDFGQPDEVCVDGVTVYKTYGRMDGLPVVRFVHPRLTSTWSALHRANADIYYQRAASMLTGVVVAFCRRHGRKSVYAGAADIDFLPGKQQIAYARDRWLFEYGLRRADAVVVQNAFQQEACLAHYGRKAVLIPSCYVPPREAAADENGSVLWVATIRDYKQPELLLEIARRLPQHRFVMVGGAGGEGRSKDVGYFDSIKAEAHRLGNVEFAGFVPYAGIDAYFNRARVFVNTSRYEGFPNTFLQAWARGVPTVSFIDPSLRSVQRPAYAVVRDVCEAAREIQRLMLDDDYWRRASSLCRSHYRAEHSFTAVVSRYTEILGALGAPR